LIKSRPLIYEAPPYVIFSVSCHFCVSSKYSFQPASYPVGKMDSFPEVKRPDREAEDSPPSSAEVKSARNYTSTSSICLHCVVLAYKHMDNFNFTVL